MNAIQETDTKLRALPKAPSNDPVGEVLHALRNFARDLDHRVEGTPEEDGLLQTIRPHQDAFKIAIRRTAPQFVPWGKTASWKELPEAAFLANEDGDDDDDDDDDDTNQNEIYIDEVLKRAQKLVFSFPLVAPSGVIC
jgi:hypothetical protein